MSKNILPTHTPVTQSMSNVSNDNSYPYQQSLSNDTYNWKTHLINNSYSTTCRIIMLIINNQFLYTIMCHISNPYPVTFYTVMLLISSPYPMTLNTITSLPTIRHTITLLISNPRSIILRLCRNMLFKIHLSLLHLALLLIIQLMLSLCHL